MVQVEEQQFSVSLADVIVPGQYSFSSQISPPCSAQVFRTQVTLQQSVLITPQISPGQFSLAWQISPPSDPQVNG